MNDLQDLCLLRDRQNISRPDAVQLVNLLHDFPDLFIADFPGLRTFFHRRYHAVEIMAVSHLVFDHSHRIGHRRIKREHQKRVVHHYALTDRVKDTFIGNLKLHHGDPHKGGKIICHNLADNMLSGNCQPCNHVPGDLIRSALFAVRDKLKFSSAADLHRALRHAQAFQHTAIQPTVNFAFLL